LDGINFEICSMIKYLSGKPLHRAGFHTCHILGGGPVCNLEDSSFIIRGEINKASEENS
jgi:hypothetical protein